MAKSRAFNLDRRVVIAGGALGVIGLAGRARAFSVVDAPAAVETIYSLSGCSGGADHAALLNDVLSSLGMDDQVVRDQAMLAWSCPLCGCRAVKP
jgi:hypothetical protein